MSWISAVNNFWFHEVDPAEWFAGAPDFDELIRSRFAALREELKAHPPKGESLNADGLLAAVIVFDQFSRNLFRNSAEAFATDALALALARYAVDHNADAALEPQRRHFIYMPFMHSEDPSMQVQSLAFFKRLAMPELIQYAENHKAVVDRFGRFPHRNAALGRDSTPEELEFLRLEDN